MLLLFLAKEELWLAGQSAVTNLSLIPLFLPEEGREGVRQTSTADSPLTPHFHCSGPCCSAMLMLGRIVVDDTGLIVFRNTVLIGYYDYLGTRPKK